MCARALGTGGRCHIDKPARAFFMFVARGPQGTAGRMTARSPPNREAGSGRAGHAAYRSPPSTSGATVHVAVPEPFLLGRRVPEPLDTWQ
jgi:hypothetical protein